MFKKIQASSFLKDNPVFPILLCLFFVFHGFVANLRSVAAVDAALLLLLYIVSTLIIAAIAWLLYRNIAKAALFAFVVMTYQFFFGKILDILKSISPILFFSQYRFVLPLSFLLFLLLITWLKKRKKPLQKLSLYLNILLLLLLVIDLGWLLYKTAMPPKNKVLHPGTADLRLCDTCKKPDIYLIVADQYANNTALKEVFNFDNSAFTTELAHRGFQTIKNSSSNYNLTPFSIASLLNMDYLTREMGVKKQLNVGYSYELIRNSSVIQYLTSSGYKFYNYSIFDFPNNPAHKYLSFLPYGTKLITAQTFTDRLASDIRSGIKDGKFGSIAAQKKIIYENLYFNDSIFALTRNISGQKNGTPKFVYSHLMLPHHPYYFNSKGEPLPLEKLLQFKKTNSDDYIEYLKYGNKKLLALVDDILANSLTAPVIMLLSDHGFRHPERTIDRKYDFMNLNAIYIPGKEYGQFNDSLAMVNQFRVFFNSCFNQNLHMLKDSTIDLWD